MIYNRFLSFLNSKSSSSSVWYICQKGFGRSEFAMALSELVYNINAKNPQFDYVTDDNKASYTGVHSLLRLFSNGYLLHFAVNKSINDSSPPGYYSLLDDLYYL